GREGGLERKKLDQIFWSPFSLFPSSHTTQHTALALAAHPADPLLLVLRTNDRPQITTSILRTQQSCGQPQHRSPKSWEKCSDYLLRPPPRLKFRLATYRSALFESPEGALQREF
ncbi:hypothetical protein B0O80DRAFT_483153, partial [Mortierella sp. GBAus27b]